MAYKETTKTKANKATKRKKIIDITKKQIGESGFSGVSMADIAKQCGMATGTLYRYFPSKQALCIEVFRIYTKIEVDLVRQIATMPDKSPAEKMIQAIEAFSHRAIKSRQLARSLIAEPLDPALEIERLQYRQAYCDIYTKLINEGIQQKQFQPQISTISAAAIVGALAESFASSRLDQSDPATQTTQNITPEILISKLTQFCLSALGYATSNSDVQSQ